jgi:signal transduction histidine kinase
MATLEPPAIDPARPRASTGWAWLLFGVGLVALAASFALRLLDARPLGVPDITGPVGFLAIGIAGLAIATRKPENAVGWLYLGIWMAVGLNFAFGSEYGYWATIAHPGAPGGTFAVWLGNWAWVPIFGVLLTWTFLLFPDGHLPSPRWRPVAWASAIVIVLWSGAFALENHDYTDAANRSVPNPYTIRSLIPFFDVAREVLALVFMVLVASSIVSLIVRFRRGHGDERQQVKWLILAASINLVFLVLPVEHGNGGLADDFLGIFTALIPASVGIAILKYRLYDIDVVIKKTVVFTVIASVLTAMYLGVIALATVGTVSRILVGILLLVVTFNPVRRAASSLADRIVYGRRASSYEVLAEFSEHMADTYATDDVLPRMAQILAGATGATRASVWLLVGGELRPAATSGGEPPRAVTAPGNTLPEMPEDIVVEVRHHGELLGALSVTTPPNDPLDSPRRKLVTDLASQAGLVLRNVRLIEELKASRQRLVAAQDQERRRIERNIHDGAQQQLVALAVKIRLAETMAKGEGAGRTATTLEQLQVDAGTALQDLRDLARGIFPPLLADKGLAEAIASQARKSSVPVDIDADGVGRYPEEIEAAVYFCSLEALQNVAKHAHASRASIKLAQVDGSLIFEVTDDGDGFDPTSIGYGTGLQGMADRLDALGGTLQVRSAPGEGTAVTGRVPTAYRQSPDQTYPPA